MSLPTSSPSGSTKGNSRHPLQQGMGTLVQVKPPYTPRPYESTADSAMTTSIHRNLSLPYIFKKYFHKSVPSILMLGWGRTSSREGDGWPLGVCSSLKSDLHVVALSVAFVLLSPWSEECAGHNS